MKHTIKLLTLAAILTAVFGLTGCPGPVNNYYIEPVVVPEYTIKVNVTNGTAEYPAKAKAGDSVTITATADEGFVFDGASSAFNIPDCRLTSDGKTITWNFSMFAEDVVINVTFKHEHNWVLESDTATCTTAGVKTYHCSRCNETRTEDSPAHHTFIAGGCDICGAFEYDGFQLTTHVCILEEYNNADDKTTITWETLYFSFNEDLESLVGKYNGAFTHYPEPNIEGVYVDFEKLLRLKDLNKSVIRHGTSEICPCIKSIIPEDELEMGGFLQEVTDTTNEFFIVTE